MHFTITKCREYGDDYAVLAFSARDKNYFYGLSLTKLPKDFSTIDRETQGVKLFAREMTQVQAQYPNTAAGWLQFALDEVNRSSWTFVTRQFFQNLIAQENPILAYFMPEDKFVTAITSIILRTSSQWENPLFVPFLQRSFVIGDKNHHKHYCTTALEQLASSGCANEAKLRHLLTLHKLGLYIPPFTEEQILLQFPGATRHEQILAYQFRWKRSLCPFARRDLWKERQLLPQRLVRQIKKQLVANPGLLDHCYMQYELWKDGTMDHAGYIGQLKYSCAGLIEAAEEQPDWRLLGRWIQKKYRSLEVSGV